MKIGDICLVKNTVFPAAHRGQLVRILQEPDSSSLSKLIKVMHLTGDLAGIECHGSPDCYLPLNNRVMSDNMLKRY